ncbi:hypothetical protein GSB9_01097 [Flavobacteriaceae bacterium GSB9]|nr:hypothetical protein GSB9_01097 [Flavobacteriaceae bacterium GSB9]
MKYIFLLVTTVLLLSCGKEKTVLLPEISHSEITEINDVSAAYLFYDETKKDSVELNRKNLISTTNWLINVDRRLTLKQAITHIKFLQDKKRNAKMHKNENAKNYFTCNDTSKKSLGFIEFTNVIYRNEIAGDYFSKTSDINQKQRFSIVFYTLNNIEITGYINKVITKKSNLDRLLNDLNSIFANEQTEFDIVLNFNQNMSFQDYITAKSKISEYNLAHVSIVKDEFIFN